ncbi:hypothetical protein RSgd_p0572 (plasmid) [Ralstonia solanacearum]
MTDEGYNTLGLTPPQAEAPAVQAAETAVEAERKQGAKAPRTRENSKQAQVIAMLRHPEGATVSEICKPTPCVARLPAPSRNDSG